MSMSWASVAVPTRAGLDAGIAAWTAAACAVCSFLNHLGLAAHANGRKPAPVDVIPNRLLVELEDARNFSDGQKLVRGLSHAPTLPWAAARPLPRSSLTSWLRRAYWRPQRGSRPHQMGDTSAHLQYPRACSRSC